MKINLDKIVAVNNDTKDEILGHLTWYSVGAQLVKYEDLQKMLKDSGICTSYMPKEITSINAFRRATKDVERNKTVTDTSGIFHNYLMREVFCDNEQIQRNIVVETVDQSGKRLDYDSKSCVITLNKKNNTISSIVSDSNPLLQEMCKEAEEKFNTYKDHYSAQQLRVMVNKILQSLSPTPVRPNGGIYFVPHVHTEGLNRLLNFSSSLEGSQGFKVPIINIKDNVEIVQINLNNHFDSILLECKSGENLSKTKVKQIIDSAKTAIKDYKDYQGIFSEESNSFENKITEMRKQVSRLIDSID